MSIQQHITIGFPRMNKEPSEKRAFLPAFIQYLTRFATVYLAEGYGSRLGFSFADYRQGNPNIFQVERKVAFQKDYVMMLRSPNEKEYCWMRKGACLISMLHYPTRPRRIQVLNELGINSISLDSIVDDNNLRLVENMRSVAWNGLEVAFDVLEKKWPGLMRPDGKPFQVLILGTGMVGKHAVEAATKLGDITRNNSSYRKSWTWRSSPVYRAQPFCQSFDDGKFDAPGRYPGGCLAAPGCNCAHHTQYLAGLAASTRGRR